MTSIVIDGTMYFRSWGACLPLVRTNDSSSDASCRFPMKVISALVLKAPAGFAVHARTLQL